MSDKVFLDTNLVIYSYSEDETQKFEIANRLLEKYENHIIISTQVINELTNTLLRKFHLNAYEVKAVISELNSNFPIVNFTLQTQLKAIEIKERYQLQFYDSLILATALENECHIVYSEDMHNGQIIEDKLTIINPFV